jgi:lysophospholipase L1-like esterase
LKSLAYTTHCSNSFAQNKAQETGLVLAEISAQIDAFNEVIKKRCEDMEIEFVYITDLTRNCAPEMIANDGLHYSAKMHQLWASLLLEKFVLQF